MNKIILFVSALLALSLVGCIEEDTHQLEQQEQATTVSVSLSSIQSKTYLSNAVFNGERAVYWEEGDAINVNGADSAPLTKEQAGFSSADFTLYHCPVPYRVVYPASIVEGDAGDSAAENVSADNMIINIPAKQKYSTTSFGKDAAILYGYGDKEGKPVELKNLCGAVKVTLKQGTDVLNKVQLVSNLRKYPIAGRYALDTKNGQYSVLKGLYAIDLEIEEVTLENGAQTFYFTIPQGSYPEGLAVKFYNKDGFPMECQWLKMPGATKNGVTIEGGNLYEFNALDFVPGKKEILTGEDWKHIAESINAGGEQLKQVKEIYLDKSNSFRLGADIVLPEGTPSVESFPYILDGRGFSITNVNASSALVMDLPDKPKDSLSRGVIKNLTLAGVYKYQNAKTAQHEASAFVHTLSGGEISNCVNEMQFDVMAKTVIFGAFARTIAAGTIKDCENKAAMNINMDVSNITASAPKSFGAGLVATCFSPTAVATMENCVNSGNITITIKVDDEGAGGVGRAGYAGIMGYVSGATAEKYPKLINCTNRGEVKLLFEGTAKSKAQYSVGGIIGLSAGLTKSGIGAYEYSSLDKAASNCYLYMEKCTNSALIQNNATSSAGSNEYSVKVYTGGIAGTLLGMKNNHAKIIDCKNTGEVKPYTVNASPYFRAAVCGICGGLLGAGGNVDIEGGEVNAKVGSAKTHTFATAGVIGCALSKFSIKGVKVKADIVRIAANDISPNDYALAVTSNTDKYSVDLSGSEISGCSFAGSLSLSSTRTYDTRDNVKDNDPSKVEVTVVNKDNLNNYMIVAKSYTKGGITLDNNVFSE